MTYSFSCKVCHRFFDKQMTLKEYEATKVRCPHCKSSKVRREYKPVEIRFTGSGFYINDSKKGK